ncbi:hypothetical protein FDG2_6392 [Candidatus Protofrankia californiensis]|uniref:Uncharacterized protein n=1 Tax=Candidatus Protofrankia californiensis TaxID=1839754 RepID=A0A1C3PH27_9ACTN|nr:hypothetical protein FDG2_6392 [Candidatus Protofrankia californiensis]
MTLEDAARAGKADSAGAFRAMVALDAALAAAKNLVEVLPSFLTVADAGTPVEEDLLRWAAEQVPSTADVAALRAELEQRRSTERELRDRAAEYELLRARVEELRHAEKVSGFLDTLRAQHRDLVERVEVFFEHLEKPNIFYRRAGFSSGLPPMWSRAFMRSWENPANGLVSCRAPV